MPFHAMGGVARVQVLDANIDALLFRIADELFESLDAVVRPLFSANFAAFGIFRVAPFVAGECDHARKAGVGASVNRLFGPGNEFFVILGVVISFDKRRSGHAVVGHGANQAVFLHKIPALGIDQLHGRASELLRHLAGFFRIPFVTGRVEAPKADGLLDSPRSHRFVFGAVSRIRE